MKSTFSVIFYLKKNKVKKDGTSPIMGRITVDGTQAQFSCKVSIEAKLWGIKGGRAIGKRMSAKITNSPTINNSRIIGTSPTFVVSKCIKKFLY